MAEVGGGGWRPCCPPVGPSASAGREGRPRPYRAVARAGEGPGSREQLEGRTGVPYLPATARPGSIGGQQGTRSRVQPAERGRGRARGECERDSRARTEKGGGWCPYIEAGPATREGSGEPQRRREGKVAAQRRFL